MKIRPRCTRNRAVASLAEPMLLLSTVNVYKPSQRSKIQRRIEGISYLSTGRCYVQVDATCYDLSLCFWTDTNERYPSFSAICRVPKTWSPACSYQQSINALKGISKSFSQWLKIHLKRINEESQWTILWFYTSWYQARRHWIKHYSGDPIVFQEALSWWINYYNWQSTKTIVNYVY